MTTPYYADDHGTRTPRPRRTEGPHPDDVIRMLALAVEDFRDQGWDDVADKIAALVADKIAARTEERRAAKL